MPSSRDVLGASCSERGCRNTLQRSATIHVTRTFIIKNGRQDSGNLVAFYKGHEKIVYVKLNLAFVREKIKVLTSLTVYIYFRAYEYRDRPQDSGNLVAFYKGYEKIVCVKLNLAFVRKKSKC